VSWNLMIGKNALWVAKQHGHSIATMLRAYAAWAEGSVETDIETIKSAITLTPVPRELPVRPTEERHGCRQGATGDEILLILDNLAVDLSVVEVIRRLCAPASAVISVADETTSHCFPRSNCSCQKWLGWKDSNLRMAGSKPQEAVDNQQVTDFPELRIPSHPISSP
jgi:hypothetical protein